MRSVDDYCAHKYPLQGWYCPNGCRELITDPAVEEAARTEMAGTVAWWREIGRLLVHRCGPSEFFMFRHLRTCCCGFKTHRRWTSHATWLELKTHVDEMTEAMS